MKYQYKVKNFRIFDEDGVKLDMAPITILTGCNSSGKSSLVKSMLLINKVLDKMSRSGKPNLDLKIDFTETPNSLLGSFDNVLHRGSESKEIVIEYTVPSLFLNEDVVVSMTFKRYGKFNGGVLEKFSVSYPNGGTLLLSEYESPDYTRFTKTFCCQDLRKAFFRYVFMVNNWNKWKWLEEDNVFSKKMQSEKEIYPGILEILKEIETYYLSNKEWLDKIGPKLFCSLVPKEKKLKRSSC